MKSKIEEIDPPGKSRRCQTESANNFNAEELKNPNNSSSNSGGLENGSLLWEALDFMKSQREKKFLQRDEDGDYGEDVLVLSIHLLDQEDVEAKQFLFKLGKLCHKANMFLKDMQQSHLPFLWHRGGEGLCFAVHCDSSSNVPHLRAKLEYGPSIHDEWYAISLAYFLSSHVLKDEKLAIEAWDNRDGQILLIESAFFLPPWVDQVGPECMQNRVWIIDGKLHLIPPSEINSLSAVDTKKNKRSKKKVRDRNKISVRIALKYLASMCKEDSKMTDIRASEEIQNAVYARIGEFLELIKDTFEQAVQKATTTSDHAAEKDNNKPFSSTPKNSPSNIHRIIQLSKLRPFSEMIHKAACVLPLNLAILLKQRPELIACVSSSFCQWYPVYQKDRSVQSSKGKESMITTLITSSFSDSPSFPYRNLVVVVLPFTRLHYSILASSANFEHPKELNSIETTRMRRKCRLEGGTASRHLRNALEVGMKITCGVEWFLRLHQDDLKREKQEQQKQKGQFPGMSTLEKRVRLYWKQLYNSYLSHSSKHDDTDNWIDEAWKEGPSSTNTSKANREMIHVFSKCPVFVPEMVQYSIASLYPFSVCEGNEDCGLNLKNMMTSSIKNSSLTVCKNNIPRQSEVDSDEWMDVKSMQDFDELLKKSQSQNQHQRKDTLPTRADTSTDSLKENSVHNVEKEDPLDQMLDGFKKFVFKNSSDMEGVDTQNENNLFSVQDYFSSDEEHDFSDEDSESDDDNKIERMEMKNIMVSILKSSQSNLCILQDNILLT